MLGSLVFLVQACTPGDLAANRPVTGVAVRGDPAALTRPDRLDDGTTWDAPGAVVLGGGGLVVDLGASRPIVALALQADNDDLYVVERSVDGLAWAPLYAAGPSRRGPGLRTRFHRLFAPVEAAQLRISARAGDGFYSVGRLRVYCELPEDWPGEGSAGPVAWWESIDNDSILYVKGGLAGAGALLLLAGAILAWRRRGHTLRRTRDALLALLGALSFCSYFNLFHFHFDDVLHMWDVYHYYVGAKYFPELGYTHLYECTTVAEVELYGRSTVQGRTIRNLVTNQLEPAGPLVDDPGRCTRLFAPERWQAFERDVRFFREQFTRARWTEVLHDHGYNGTPVWGAAGGVLAGVGPATHAQLVWLGLLDPLLLCLMWAAIIWAFGWRVACVGLLWWGTNYPARYWWNGGAFLRMDWLAFAMIGICLVKRERHRAGGFAVTTSALLRVFPGFIVVGLALHVLATWVGERRIRLGAPVRRFLVGGALAVATLVPASIALAPGHGAGAFVEFIDNSRKHLETPLTNNMGLRTVVAYSARTRARVTVDPSLPEPFGRWKDARRHTFGERKLLYFAALAAMLALVAWAARPLPEWVALVLGVGLIPFLAELTCYYYSFLLAFAFLWPRRPLIGVGLCAVSALSCATPWIAWWDDARYFNISCYVLAFVVLATIHTRWPQLGADQGNNRA